MSLMRRLVEESLQGGAFGMSTGLMYAPGMFTKPEEIVELAKGGDADLSKFIL